MSQQDDIDPGHDVEAAMSEQVPGRDGGPIDEADMAAADDLTASEETARSYEEMLERGANQQGEGRAV